MTQRLGRVENQAGVGLSGTAWARHPRGSGERTTLSRVVLMRLEDEGQGWQGQGRLSIFDSVRLQETGSGEA